MTRKENYKLSILLLVMILLSGCSTYRPVDYSSFTGKLAVTPEKREEILDQLARKRNEIKTIRILGDLTLADGTTGKAIIVASFAERKIRIEILPPQTGQSLMIAAIQGNSALILIPPERRAIKGTASQKNLRRVFGAAVEPEELLSVLTGRFISDTFWSSIDIPKTTVTEDDSSFYITTFNQALLARIDKESGLVKELIRNNVFNQNTIYTARSTLDSTPEEQIYIPSTLELRIYQPENHQAQLDIKSVQINAPPRAEVFKLTVPRSYLVERF